MELRHKASGSTGTDNQASGLVANSSGKRRGKKNLKKSGNSKGGLKPNDVCKYCKEKENVLKRSIRRINLGLLLLLFNRKFEF